MNKTINQNPISPHEYLFISEKVLQRGLDPRNILEVEKTRRYYLVHALDGVENTSVIVPLFSQPAKAGPPKRKSSPRKRSRKPKAKKRRFPSLNLKESMDLFVNVIFVITILIILYWWATGTN